MSTVPFTPKQGESHPDANALTERQRKVLDAIKTHLAQRGFAPSFREIGEAAGLKSPSSVKHQLQVLEEKGFIRMSANKGRAIEVVDPEGPASGNGVAEVIPFPTGVDSSESIIDAAICDGDFVVVREQHTAENGDIVAALLDDEATVKTFRKDHGHVWLIPHNPAYSPIDGTHAEIMGKVVTVLRKI